MSLGVTDGTGAVPGMILQPQELGTGGAALAQGHAAAAAAATGGGGANENGGTRDEMLDRLAERLRVSDEWNLRLQHQLQELLELPRCEVEQMRDRMQNPDIAIPLLQCYDAAIQEKAEVIVRLESEVLQLRAALEEKTRKEGEWLNDVQVTEGLLKRVQAQAAEEIQKEAARNQALEGELGRLRLEMRRALEAAHEERRRAEAAQQQIQALQNDLKRLTVDKSEVEDALDVLQRKTKLHYTADEEKELQGEAQRVRLQMLSRENEDKLQELERLRSKMVQALRQASDNHAAHLRIVEERHRLAVEDLRQVNRTHEMEILKLRAQLARLDPDNPTGSHLRRLNETTTSALLDAQTRQAQDIEIKRLYGELGNAQRQRDEALDRLHQVSQSMQEKERGLVEDHRREGLQLQKRLHELRGLTEKKDSECNTLQAQCQQLREKLKKVESEAAEARSNGDSVNRQVEELRRRNEDLINTVKQLEAERDRRSSEDQALHTQLEERVEEVLSDLRQSRSKAQQASLAAEKERHELRLRLEECEKKLLNSQQTIARKDREREVLDTRMSKLQEALAAHKQQLATCDLKLMELYRGKEELQRQQRVNIISTEHLKMENARLQQMRNGF